ncbi:MAG: glycosyltransferase family 2 protein [Pirellulales bacterium]
MLTIVVPMAGRGARFQEAGYREPKPLIPIHGIPMIEAVVNNLRPREPHRFVFICQQEHDRAHGLGRFLRALEPACEVICIDGVTAGAACTVLTARHLIDTPDPLMIANCDQWIDFSIDEYLSVFGKSGADGLIMTMKSNSPKWSFVKRDARGRVEAVVEKQVVSDEATVGIYNFASGSDFVAAADFMIEREMRVNNEFYVAPVYTQLIARGRRIETLSIGSDRDRMHGLGTPADLERFLTCDLKSRLAAERMNGRRAA